MLQKNNKLAIPRLMHFIAMLKENRYPNHPRLVEEMRKLDIAGAYNVTQKTVQRDVNFLKSAYHAPIQYDFFHKGYFLTDPEWNLDVPFLRQTEMEAAVLSTRLAEMIMPNPVGGGIRKSMDNLLAVCDVPAVDERTTLLALIATGSKVPIKPEIFEEVFKGWRTRHTLMMSYTRAKDGHVSDLLVEPHVLAFHEGCWYLKVRLIQSDKVAYEAHDIITLAVHRINHVTTTANTFATDASIVENSRNGKIFDFPMIQNVSLKLTGKGVIYGPEAFHYSSIKKHKDGSVVIHIPEVEEYKIMNFVLIWAGEAQILAPAELVSKVSLSAKQIQSLHKLEK